MAAKMVEIQRNNVTVAEFLRYIDKMCAKNGLERGFSRDDFEAPHIEYASSYHVKDGKKHCRFTDTREVTKWRSVHASYVLPGGSRRYYATGEFEEYTVTERYSYEQICDEDKECPAISEIMRLFPYDYQVYGLMKDGTCYNENCEFTFDDDNHGHGYYYQVQKDADAETSHN